MIVNAQTAEQFIDQNAVACINTANTLTINSKEEKEQAIFLLTGIAELTRAIEAHYDPHIKIAYEAHKSLTTAKKEALSQLIKAKDSLKAKLSAWELAEEARKAEARKAEEARIAAEAASEPDNLDIAMPTETRRQEPEKVDGFSSRDKWEFEVVDKTKIPGEYLTVDMDKIKRLVEATRGEILIPGIRIVKRKVIAIRTR